MVSSRVTARTSGEIGIPANFLQELQKVWDARPDNFASIKEPTLIPKLQGGDHLKWPTKLVLPGATECYISAAMAKTDPAAPQSTLKWLSDIPRSVYSCELKFDPTSLAETIKAALGPTWQIFRSPQRTLIGTSSTGDNGEFVLLLAGPRRVITVSTRLEHASPGEGGIFSLVSWSPVPRGIPDDSAFPIWSTTLSLLLDASQSQFAILKDWAKPTPHRLTDEELVTGKVQKAERPLPKLPGADICNLREAFNGHVTQYQCYYLLPGSAADLQQAYIRLVRLVERVTGVQHERLGSPHIAPNMETRTVSFTQDKTFIHVDGFWVSNQIPIGPEGSSHVSITVWSKIGVPQEVFDEAITPTVASGSPRSSEIDEIIKSGSYSPMFPYQHLSSSGSGPVVVEIVNNTNYSLTLAFDGLSFQQLTVAPEATSTIQLTSGTFRVMGRLSAPNVLPFIGSETFGPGDRVRTIFYLSSTSNR